MINSLQIPNPNTISIQLSVYMTPCWTKNRKLFICVLAIHLHDNGIFKAWKSYLKKKKKNYHYHLCVNYKNTKLWK